MNARKNYNRFSDDPVLDENGKPITAHMTGQQARIVQALSQNNILTINDMWPLVGGNKRWLYTNIRILKARNNGMIRALPEQVRDHNITQPLCLQLAPNGVTWLNKDGGSAKPAKRVHPGYRSHAVLASHILASIQAGVQQADARIVSWEEMKAHPRYPGTPDKEAISIEHPSKSRFIKPDCHPFRIQLLKDGNPIWRTIVIEADNGTETLKPGDPAHYKGSSIYEKFEAYEHFMKTKGYEKQYGVSNFFVLFVFIFRPRLDHAKEILNGLVGSSRFFLFQQAYPDPEVPGGYIFNSACERVGYPPIFLNQP